jgi:hypothetical protein
MPSGDEISFPKRELCQKNYNDVVALGDMCPSCFSVKNSVARFRMGHLSTKKEEYSESNSIDNFRKHGCHHSIILDNQNISTKKDNKKPWRMPRKSTAIL